MIVKRVRVKNFRSIRDVTVEIGDQFAIVGGNGCGKSSILRAIEKFFAQSTSVEIDDFFGRQVSNPIEIELTFIEFTDAEKEKFASRIHNEEMTVVRVFEASGGKSNGKYYGATMQHPDFAEVRRAENATNMRTAYNAIRAQSDLYATLPAVTKGDQVIPALQVWEDANPQNCELCRDDGQFFGFTNVARGALQKSTSLVFVPAVRDASADSMDARGAVVARLLELVVRSAIQRRDDIQKFQARVSSEYKTLTDPEKLTELGELSTDLTTTLRVFYREAGVRLKWAAANDFSLPLPAAEVFLDDDGFEGPVDKKGHGLQRAFILTLLQHLAKATSADVARKEEDAKVEVKREELEEDVSTETSVEDEAVTMESEKIEPFTLPGLILAIEEPELYQHPTKQRHFAKVLSLLSSGELPGVARKTQVIFATHSSLFVSTDRFEQIGLAHRRRVDGCKHKECQITTATLTEVARKLEFAYGKEEGTFSAEGLRARLHIIDSEIAEGFFADAVVLVEGTSDRAAILATAALKKIDLGALGVAVLAVDGKTKMDRPTAIFGSLDVPLFIIWDCDRTTDGAEGKAQNIALQRLMGAKEEDLFEAQTTVSANYACFEHTLERTLKDELGADAYFEHLKAVKEKYGIERNDDAEKAPFVMSELLERLAKIGKRSATLEKIIDAIGGMRAAMSIDVSIVEGNDNDAV